MSFPFPLTDTAREELKDLNLLIWCATVNLCGDADYEWSVRLYRPESGQLSHSHFSHDLSDATILACQEMRIRPLPNLRAPDTTKLSTTDVLNLI